MPAIGEIKTGKQRGLRSKNKYIYAACTGCGKGRWVQIVKGRPRSNLCSRCCHLEAEDSGQGCLFCHQYIKPGDRKEVAIHTLLDRVRQGVVHEWCWKEYRDRLQTRGVEKQRKSIAHYVEEERYRR